MYELYNDIVCIQAGSIIEAGIISKANYHKLARRHWLNVVRRGCKGTPALVTFDSIPERFRDQIVKEFGAPNVAKSFLFKDQIEVDHEAAAFYSAFKISDGRSLPEDKQREYRTNAEILNTINTIIAKRKAKRKSLGGSSVRMWDSISEAVNKLNTEHFPHSLPLNVRRLKDKLKAYKEDGYQSLIHKGCCNSNSRKVTAQIERLILSLYCDKNKPYSSSVHEMYLKFLGNAIDVVDVQTGEVFEPLDFYENGKPVMISDATVWNYINDPKNRVIVDRYRSGAHQFNNEHRPHHHRTKPMFSLSKVSMDDRDLPRKLPNGKRVKAYYAYDVASGAVIGASYSRDKDTTLFIDCMRDMFRNLHHNSLGVPMEVEVEHHLVNRFRDDLMKAGVVFPFVRWCNPGNSQEKHAEHFNKTKKYDYEKRYQEGIGRWYAKLEANRVDQEKIFDAENDNYKEKTFRYEQLVADDQWTIEQYNNDLHPDQKRYKGMTRMDVLLYCANPNLAKYDKSLLAMYIGEKTATSLRRSQYVKVQYENYQLPDPELLNRFEPNNYSVDAYYIPEPDGTIDEVFIYQNGLFISECQKIIKYNTAKAEQTEDDIQSYQDQSSYVRKFDKMVKDSKQEVGRVKVVERVEMPDIDVEVVHTEAPQTLDDIESLLAQYESSDYDKQAKDNL